MSKDKPLPSIIGCSRKLVLKGSKLVYNLLINGVWYVGVITQ